MRCLLVICLLAIGCGDNNEPPARPDARQRIDAAVPTDGALGDGSVDAMVDAGPQAFDCTAYCAVIQGACTADNEQYESTADCMRACATFPAGTEGMTMTNTLGCRLTHANAAAMTPASAATECPAAGPAGDTTCGTTCTAFCGMIDDVCPGQWNATLCPAQCLARGNLAGSYNTTAAAMSGDTEECRLYWATAGMCANTVRNNNPVCD